MLIPEYQVTAVRYGTATRLRSTQFHRYNVYDEPDGEIVLDYFFWIISDGETIVLVDTGYHPDSLQKRSGGTCIIPPLEALRRLGIAASDVSRIVISHFHYDHVGNVSAFPQAQLFLQRRELDFWTGPNGSRPAVLPGIEPSEISYLENAYHSGRAEVLDGNREIAPGIYAEMVGGHCPGQQLVIVEGERPLVLCSDALHFYEEMDRRMPYTSFVDLPAMYDTYDVLERHESQKQAIIVAGHDPAVMSRFPRDERAPDLAVRLR
jgi:glyoxylase-like metal-dependent hydrolase (beta-lactamase superfamily II)